MKIAVLGGTRFFGKRLVKLLIKEGHEVTVFSRGNTPIPIGARSFIGDRENPEDLKSFFKDSFEIVYDQICFNATSAQKLLDSISPSIKKIIFASTTSVYLEKGGMNLMEEDIPTHNFEIDMSEELEYHKGKQMAEAYYFQHSNIPVIALRIPFVMGEDDFTERTLWHLRKIKNHQEIFMPNPDAHFPIMHTEDVANALNFIKDCEFDGPLNATANKIQLKELLESIKATLSLDYNLASQATQDNHSPYGIPHDVTMNGDKITALGFKQPMNVNWFHDLLINLKADL